MEQVTRRPDFVQSQASHWWSYQDTELISPLSIAKGQQNRAGRNILCIAADI